ncbi:MAG TPA: PA14 domain-containing protein [Cyclobacteriaceae bacterium]|jgi:predicted peptidase|nr:PA14 domain-containing protein [Cyclobacteriaceae bacterium]
MKRGYSTIVLLLAWMLLCMSFVVNAQTVHFQGGNSMRNSQLGHYYQMVTWDDTQYQEFAYWLSSSGGSVVEFMNWRILFPQGYQQSGTTKYPMIIFLHGAGESGRQWTTSGTGSFNYAPTDPQYDNNDAQLTWGGSEHLQAVNAPTGSSRSFPGIVVFPQVSYNGSWSTGTWSGGQMTNNGRMAVSIIEHLISTYNVDQHKIYIHGLSNGAKGIWDVASKRPDLFAAMLAMSGVGTDINIETDIQVTTPLWLFQGGLDTNPSPGWAQQWITALRNKGGNPRYTLYPNNDHNTWQDAYQEPDFFSWMLAQDKRSIYVFGGSTSLINNPSIKLGFSDGFLSYQWTLNGVDLPGDTTRYITVTQAGSYAVKFTRRTDGVTDVSFATQITGPPPPPPSNGVTYKYWPYSGSLASLSAFDFNQTSTASGTTNNFNLSVRQRNDHYVLSFDGYLQIDNAGTYTFYANSDDGSRIYINATLVANNDSIHTSTVRSGTYNFPNPGLYPIRVVYYQELAGEILNIRYNQGTRNNYGLATGIPDNKLFLSDPTSSSSTRYAAANSSIHPTEVAGNGDNENSSNKGVAFPNPFHQTLYVQLPDSSFTSSAQLYDVLNNRIARTMQFEVESRYAAFDFSDLPKGQYVLMIGNSRFRVFKID